MSEKLNKPKRAVISLSGGLDSTCLLMKLLSDGYEVRAYSFNYGQKHDIELVKVKNNIDMLNRKGIHVEHQIIDLRSAFSGSASSLHSESGVSIPEGHYADENMKSTVVENRNIIFSSIVYGKALAWANHVEDNVVITLGLHSGDHCFTEDTNILTKNGTKTVNDMSIGDEVISLNINTQKWEWKPITDIIKKGVPEDIYRISTYAGDIKLTDEHKVYRLKLGNFDPHYGYEKSIEMVHVKELTEGDYLIQPTNISTPNTNQTDMVDLYEVLMSLVREYDNGPIVECDENEVYSSSLKHRIPRYIKNTDIAELMAWYIAEGWSKKDAKTNSNNSKGSRYSASFCQSLKSNLEKVDLIVDLMNRIDFKSRIEFSKKTYNNIPQEMNVYLSGLVSIILQSGGSHSACKSIPDWLMNILISSDEARETFLYTMGLADGFNTDTQYRGFCSISEELISQMIYLIQLSGYHFSVNNSKYKTKYITYSKMGQKRALISLGDAKFTKITSIEKMNNDLNVYDITVEDNHNFVAGQYGSLLISNSIYPDCRPESQEMAKELFRISNWNSERVDYIAPFVHIDKGQVLSEGVQSMKFMNFSQDEINYVLTNTHTCYNPDGLGRSCGKCGSCTERLEAFSQNQLVDPIPYM